MSEQTWQPAAPGDTPGTVVPDDARPQPIDVARHGEFIVINGHAPWCTYIKSLHLVDGEEPCDCSGWDDDDPCRCGAWDPVENDHTVSEHYDCGGSLHNSEPPCGGCDSCISAQVSYYKRLEREEV